MTDDERTPAAPEPARPAPRQSLLLPVVIPLGLLAIVGLVLWGFSRVLLRVEPKVATVTALLVASSIVAIVAIAASRKRVTSNSLLTVVGGVFGVAMLLSGAALLVGTAKGESGVETVAVALAAPKGAAVTGFDLKTLTAPADTPFTIAFNNQDPACSTTSSSPRRIREGPVGGDLPRRGGHHRPQRVRLRGAGAAGRRDVYFCKIHPTTMKGVLTVAVGAQPGTGASGNVITAENLAFDRDTLSFPADTASTLTFQNNDAGVPHNVAIYPDASSSKALFTGDLVTGVATATYNIPALPAGSYYFHCDVHPDMNGTVTVGNEAGGPPSAVHRRAGAPRRPPRARHRRAAEAPPPQAGATVTASGLAFDPTTISLPAGTASTITLDNQDAGVPHNISIWPDDTYSGDPLFTGDPVTGVARQDYDIPALEPGTYAFRCDIHPTMTGSITVG
jgi:plastocyanin